jgi:hypothetical protein
VTISAQLYSLLANATDAAARVYPLVAPQDVARPYITFQGFDVPDTVLGGKTGLVHTRMQVDGYATTHALADTLKAQIEAQMAGWSVQNVELSAQDLYETDTKLFRVLLDYSIWHD